MESYNEKVEHIYKCIIPSDFEQALNNNPNLPYPYHSMAEKKYTESNDHQKEQYLCGVGVASSER